MTGNKADLEGMDKQEGCSTVHCAANDRTVCRWRSDVERCTQWEPDSSGLLWRRLRKGVLGGHRFVRRYSVGELTIDFYCPKKRLAIEVEPPCGYEDRRGRTRERQMIIDYFGVIFMKVTSSEIHDDMDGVLARIEELASRTSLAADGFGEDPGRPGAGKRGAGGSC